MTEQEKLFLKKLGITPGPWKRICFNDIIASDMSGKITSIESDRPIAEDKSNSALMSKSPEMFLSLWKSALQFRYYCQCHFEKGKTEKLKINQEFYNMCINDCIQATRNKFTFIELFEIWESCSCLE